MFTGIIEEVGEVADITEQTNALRLTIAASTVLGDAQLGDSIAVNGVCLTVAERDDNTFTADVMQETLNRSSLGTVTVGSKVNLERAAQVGSRLDGHIVQGHVDGTAEVISRTADEHWEIVRFTLPADLARYVVEKGSISIDGTSLTVSALGDDWFEVSLIPVTLTDSVVGLRQPGDIVNVEVDVVAKYIEKMLPR
ncbi:riboflavin synthase [Corynebacterium ulceribovis]|uniref:riboflavin synthase n=1 Tax=Corynebacterium ulceribovis TaxID=487732 RepID=UPI00037327D6|nr:riboflavin synthase [Corynebacterium ulceribovis]